MSTVNIVKYYFYKGTAELAKGDTNILDLSKPAIQWPSANVYTGPKVHETTSINSVRQKDTLGPHVTLCYRDKKQLSEHTHVASHGYVTKDGLEFVQATHAGQKADSAKRQQEKKTVWLSEDELDVVPEIGYSHLPSN